MAPVAAVSVAMLPVAAATVPADGQQAMLTLLAQIATDSIEDNEFIGEAGARPYRDFQAKGTYAKSPAIEVRNLRTLAQHELRLGNTEAALKALEQAWALVQQPGFHATPAEIDRTQFELAVAYLRWGENSNCVARHTSQSCILPIGEAGVHVDQNGSRRGIAELSALLERHSDDLVARWLLNLAYMTVGEYPDEVPVDYLIPSSTFESAQPFPRFKEIAAEAGVNTRDLAGGAVIDDFDGDGVLDIVVSSTDPRSGLRYFAGKGDGTFSERSEQAGFTGLLGGANLVQGDYDGDGATDILVLRGAWLGYKGRHPKSLLRNDGHARFTDVTFAAGLAKVHYPSQSAAWADYDNDGDLDLYVGNEAADNFTYVSQLFRNEGDGAFTDVAFDAGVINGGFTKGVAWGDFDGDGWQDLYVSNYNGSNRLYRNRGDGTFVDIATEARVRDPFSSFGVATLDFDNDGILDLFVAATTPLHKGLAHGGRNIDPLAPLADFVASTLGLPNKGETGRLYRGLGGARFQDVTVAQGLGRVIISGGLGAGDIDGDGFVDLYIGTSYQGYEGLMPNVMYLNKGGTGFADVTSAAGLGHLQKAGAIALADLDADGDQDIFVNTGGMFRGDSFGDALFANRGPSANGLDVRLVGTRSNRSALGARLRVDITEGGRSRSIYRVVGGGGSYGAGPLRQWIGVGGAQQVDALEITWPADGAKQVLRDLPVSKRLEIVEGAP